MRDWLRLKAVPDRVDALERRIAALEGQRSGAAPDPWACLRCGMRLRVETEAPHPQFGVFGQKRLTLACPSCLDETTRDFDPARDAPPPR